MAQTLRIKYAGGLTCMSLSPRVKPKDGYHTRREKHRLASQAQKAINGKAAYINLEFLLAANILPGDRVVTLTYADEYLPPNWTAADKLVKAYIRRARSRASPGMIYFYNIERAHYSPRPLECHRYHHHIPIHCSLTDDELQALWPWGHIESHPFILDAEHTYGSMAKYMIKERGEFPGKRAWRSSRGLKKPETDCMIVPDDYILPTPDRHGGCMILEDEGPRVTEYGRFQTVKYQLRGLTNIDSR